MTGMESGRKRSFRPQDQEYIEAASALEERNISVTQYLRATLRWVASEPDAALDVLGPVVPPPRAVGRPSASSAR